MRSAPALEETEATRIEGHASMTLPQDPTRQVAEPLRTDELVGGRYRVVRHVARGGFGEVYEAEDERSGTLIALKLLRTSNPDASALDALRGEFALLGALRHPSLASVHDFGYLRDAAYFTQDFVRGKHLDRAAIDLGTPRGIALVGELARALDYLHARGILHRDVKPSNVMVEDASDRLVLLDFGIARALGERSHDGLLVGSFAYIPPEAIKGQPLDARSDLYSLGVTLYRIASGHLPFAAKDRDATEIFLDHVHTPPPPLPDSVPPAVAEVVMRLLAKEPGDRFASAGELLEALARAAGIVLASDTPETLASYVLSARYVDDSGLLGRLEAAIDRRAPSPILVVVGDAGTGKSRTLRELRHGLLLRGIPWVAVETRSDGEVLLRDIAEGVIDGSVAKALDDEDRIALARGVPRLRRPRERIAVPVDPERARELRIEALGRAAASRFGEGPGVVCIEDLHRAAEGAVRDVARWVSALEGSGAHCTVLVTARPGQSLADLERLSTIERYAARPLDPNGSRGLIGSMLGHATVLDDTELGTALSNAEHPALWVQESLRLAIDTGALERRFGAWTVTREIRPLELEDVLASRLLSLSPDARNLALAAAVLGEASTVADFARVVGRSVVEAARALAELVRAGIAEERLGPTHRTLYAMHDRYRDVAPSLLSPADEKRAHAGAARLLLQRKDDARQLERAAKHLERAGHARAAMRCFKESSRIAERAGRPEVALALLDAALRAGGSRPVVDLLRRHDLALTAANAIEATASLVELGERDEGATPIERLEIALRQARRAAQEGRAEVARALVGRVVADAEGIGARPLLARAKTIEGETERIFGSFDRSAAAYRAAADLAREVGDRSEEATAWIGASFAEVHLGRPASAIEAARRAIRAGGTADPALRSDALRQLGNVLRQSDHDRQAAATYRRSVAAARRAGCLEREAKALNNLGTVAQRIGDVQEAILAFERSIMLKGRAGAQASVMLGLNNLAALYLATGAFAEARVTLEQVLENESVAALAVICAGNANLADLDLFAGRLDDAIRRYHIALESCRERNYVVEMPHVLSGLARALLRRRGPGDLEAASESTRELVSIAEQIATPLSRRRMHTARAVLFDAQGEADQALDAARQSTAALDTLSFYDVIATPIEARWILAITLARVGRAASASRVVASAQRTLSRLADCFRDPGRRATFLTSSPIHVAIARGELGLAPGTTWWPTATP